MCFVPVPSRHSVTRSVSIEYQQSTGSSEAATCLFSNTYNKWLTTGEVAQIRHIGQSLHMSRSINCHQSQKRLSSEKHQLTNSLSRSSVASDTLQGYGKGWRQALIRFQQCGRKSETFVGFALGIISRIRLTDERVHLVYEDLQHLLGLQPMVLIRGGFPRMNGLWTEGHFDPREVVWYILRADLANSLWLVPWVWYEDSCATEVSSVPWGE
jgi:hypothetical protein